MKASEAIAILEAIDPDSEVTLTLATHTRSKPGPHTSNLTYLPSQHWQGSFWPDPKQEVTLKFH